MNEATNTECNLARYPGRCLSSPNPLHVALIKPGSLCSHFTRQTSPGLKRYPPPSYAPQRIFIKQAGGARERSPLYFFRSTAPSQLTTFNCSYHRGVQGGPPVSSEAGHVPFRTSLKWVRDAQFLQVHGQRALGSRAPLGTTRALSQDTH